MARSRSRNSGSRALTGLSTSRPASAASSATGLGAIRRPRPVGASGRVITAATSCRDRRIARNEDTAVGGVPAKTRRIRSARLALRAVRRNLDLPQRVAPPLGLADGLHGQLALLVVQPVDEQHAVQVVGLVLDAAGQLLGALQ